MLGRFHPHPQTVPGGANAACILRAARQRVRQLLTVWDGCKRWQGLTFGAIRAADPNLASGSAASWVVVALALRSGVRAWRASAQVDFCPCIREYTSFLTNCI